LVLVRCRSRLAFFACAKKVTKETHPGRRALRASCPAGTRRRSGGSLSVRPCTPANARASCARPFGLYLRAFAAPNGAPLGGILPQKPEHRSGLPRRSPWMDGFVDHGTVRGAEHRRLCRKCPKGRGDGSPRLRSSTRMYCLSNPARARSAGDSAAHEARRNTASGARPFWLLFGAMPKSNPLASGERKLSMGTIAKEGKTRYK